MYCIPVYIFFLFWLCNGVMCGLFWVVPGAFYFVFVNQNFRDFFADYFACPPSYFTRIILVLFCCVIYSVFVYVLCVFCVPFKSYVVSPCAALHV